MKKLEIELPEKYKNIIKDATIEIIDGKIIITPKKQEFKDGDILFANDSVGGKVFCIYKKDNEIGTGYYYSLSDEYGSEIDNDHWDIRLKFRLATEEEKQVLFNALEKEGKRWNPETKQIKDILKVGDLAIFWDYDKKESCISSYIELDNIELYPKGYNFASIMKDEDECHIFFKNAIKCTSLEQYINFKK